jgi:type I restriction enzyme R subunit
LAKGEKNLLCILIVTDRTDLDDQISGTFRNCNFPNPVHIQSVEHLKQELQNPQGKTLFTTIQKFQTEKGELYPELSRSSNIIVFADEAHRSQYRGLALNMRTAIPNAISIGFTGTPIDKNDKSTPRVFGSYIHKYLPKQSVADGATAQIKYQARKPEVHIMGSELDVAFDSEFWDYTDQQQEIIRENQALTGQFQRMNNASVKSAGIYLNITTLPSNRKVSRHRLSPIQGMRQSLTRKFWMNSVHLNPK